MDEYQGHMRMSLPPGELLRGEKHTYTVGHIASLSERSVTVSAESEDGGRWRIKYYNGKSAVTMEMLERLMALPVKGAVLPVDAGLSAGIVFAVFPVLSAESLDRRPLPLGLLAERIIPQLFDMADQCHRNGILLRDICPEHILYLPDEGRAVYCGFGNAVQLAEGEETSRSPGCGQHFSYLAPEINGYGYSRASDYFSIGATILTLVEGRNPAESMPEDAYLSQIKEGMAPGIDVGHLQDIPYELYSLEDKLLYLALGLLNADPRKRWGAGEVRCFGNGEEIPLVPEGEKTDYRFSESFVIGGRKCWNEKELAKTAAADRRAWNEETLRRLSGFLGRQRLECAAEISEYTADRSISPKGRIFRCIYTLYPALDGLWWDGERYADMGALTGASGVSREDFAALSRLLRDRCFSFLCRAREKAGASGRDLRAEFEQFEDWERAEPGKGLYRCMMRFAPDKQSRFFMAEGKKYRSIRQLLTDYRECGDRLRTCSGSILSEPSFLAWLWARGMERAGEKAAGLSGGDLDISFFLLLGICESQAEDEETKRLAREMYLRSGEYAPVVWLAGHTGAYSVISPIDQALYDVFRRMEFAPDVPLAVLAGRAREAVADYQIFVGRTSDRTCRDAGATEDRRYGYLPFGEEYRFCCKWRDTLEVCPAFINDAKQTLNMEYCKSETSS